MLKLPGLERLDEQMRTMGQVRCQFPWRNGRLRFAVLYLRDAGDAFGPDDWRSKRAGHPVYPYSVLSFIESRTNFTFYKFVTPYFTINTFMGEDYGELKRLIESGGGGPALDLAKFFEHFDDCVPASLSSEMLAVRPEHVPLPRDVEEADKRFFMHVQRPPRGRPSAANLRKTRMILGEGMALFCQRHGLSSFWTDYPVNGWTTGEICRQYGVSR